MTTAPSPLIVLSDADNVAVARHEIAAQTDLPIGGATLVSQGLIPSGHKIALRAIASGEVVRKYGQVIGLATQAIAPGEHVHTHNLDMGGDRHDHRSGTGYRPTAPATVPASFQGIVRRDGRVGTRNYLGVIASVNCSATVCRYIADAFKGEALRDYPQVDGVVAITHGSGCGMSGGGEGIDLLRRTLRGYADHPNFAGVLVIGLGCEVNQIAPLVESLNAREPGLVSALTIQDEGGTREAVERGVALLREMLPLANAVARTEVSASHLTVGLQCGGSDGYSGISANPALGAAVDRLVRHGGTAILSESPEVYGGEHLLTRRAVSQAVADKLVARLKWWEDYTARNGGEMDNNPSAGNKAGGLTTILEKSLGAIAKSGTTNLVEVYEYAQAVTARGLVFMDTPGYDPVSATGQVAGGANLICFTTGRGSAYGCAPSPSLKLGTNTALWLKQEDDIDLNCGEVVDGTASIDELGERIFRLMLETASGRHTKSELHGYGQNEFVPWQLGAVM
ncbi:MAG: altronate dehydratase [Rhizobacter sp.]|nr:altronate dehydratase [Rhizobacter sp.]